jgi:hypothetical protein
MNTNYSNLNLNTNNSNYFVFFVIIIGTKRGNNIIINLFFQYSALAQNK